MNKIRRNTKNTKVEVTDITANGCRLRFRSKDYDISFVGSHPYFLGASVDEIKQVTLLGGDTFQWESLDIYLDVDNFEHPRRYPYLMLSKEQLERIQDVLKHPERYPDIKFTKRQRESLQSKIERIAEHRRKQRLHELKKQFLTAREELRALGGDVTTDNDDFYNEP